MSAFHLRPVSEPSPSPSPSDSTAPTGDRSPPFNSRAHSHLPPSPPPSSHVSRSRRPLSPSSLRDVDLTHDTETPPRKYPAPPTGHELMALFPPAPPANFPEMRPGPTSGYFQRQERAFFAQAGKEIVRVRVEVDVPQDIDMEGGHKSKARDPAAQTGGPRSWPAAHHQHSSQPQHSPPQSSTGAPLPYPHTNARPPRGGPVPVATTSLFPTTPHPQPNQPPPNLHSTTLHHPSQSLRTPQHDPTHPGASGPKVEYHQEEYREDPDESWRRPMPYAERRRAGKHTRRVIVRN